MAIFESLIRTVLHHIGTPFRTIQIAFLRSSGVKIGKNCMISFRAKIDTRRGRISIGDNCVITYGCILLSHDRSAMHIDSNDDGEGNVVLGNNVYLGVHTVVLRNVTIGDGSVVGAGSVVTKDIPPGVVAAGNPARVIKEILRYRGLWSFSSIDNGSR